MVGYSDFSEEIIIRAASVPSRPTNVVTTLVSTGILITWTEPYNGGSAITAYQVVVMQSDYFTYTESVADCDGTGPSVVGSQSCIFSFDTLTEYPFSLAWGSSIYAKIKAINVVGESSYSLPGNGAAIYTVPDPPQSLANNLGSSTLTAIGLTWYEGISNGGASVLDYRLYIAEEGGDY